MEETFLYGQTKKTKRKVLLKISGEYLTIISHDSGETVEQINLVDAVGCHMIQDSSGSLEQSLLLRIYWYPLQPGKKKRAFRFLSIQPCVGGDAAFAQCLKAKLAVLSFVRGLPKFDTDELALRAVNSLQKLLVLVNPKSGKGSAKKVFSTQIAVMLSQADVCYDAVFTSGPQHARRLMKNADLGQHRGIVVVSGDGLLFETSVFVEMFPKDVWKSRVLRTPDSGIWTVFYYIKNANDGVVNGLLERSDWETAIRTPIGIIPQGSGNGIARTLADSQKHVGRCLISDRSTRSLGYMLSGPLCGTLDRKNKTKNSPEPYLSDPVLVSTLSVIRSRKKQADLMRVLHKSSDSTCKTHYACLSVGYGLLADIDIESERLRKLGEARFSVWAVHRLLSLRTYKAKLSYLPAASEHESPTVPLAKPRLLHSVTVVEDSAFKRPLRRAFSAYEDDDAYSVAELAEEDALVAEEDIETSDHVFGPSSRFPPLSEPVPEDWVTLDGDFVMIYAVSQKYIGTDILFAPKSKLDDGLIYLFILKADATKSQLLQFLFGMENGTHVDSSCCQVVPVTAFRLEPGTTNGHLTVDGELLPTAPIQVEVLPSMLTFLMR